MIAAGGGSIINLGSDSWWRAGGGFPVYTTAKAAVHGLTRGMARDLGPHRIRVNTLVPGWTMTERQKRLWVTPEQPRARSSPRSACLIRSSRSTSRGWRCSWPRTTPPCARRTTTWWRRDRSSQRAMLRYRGHGTAGKRAEGRGGGGGRQSRPFTRGVRVVGGKERRHRVSSEPVVTRGDERVQIDEIRATGTGRLLRPGAVIQLPHDLLAGPHVARDRRADDDRGALLLGLRDHPAQVPAVGVHLFAVAGHLVVDRRGFVVRAAQRTAGARRIVDRAGVVVAELHHEHVSPFQEREHAFPVTERHVGAAAQAADGAIDDVHLRRVEVFREAVAPAPQAAGPVAPTVAHRRIADEDERRQTRDRGAPASGRSTVHGEREEPAGGNAFGSVDGDAGNTTRTNSRGRQRADRRAARPHSDASYRASRLRSSRRGRRSRRGQAARTGCSVTV